MTDKAKWLAGLKVGDPVIVQSSGIPVPGRAAGLLTVVERFTNTQIIVSGNSRFRRDDGYALSSGGYDRAYLEEATTDRKAAIRHEMLAAQCKGTHWKELPLATLEAVAELVAKAGKEKR